MRTRLGRVAGAVVSGVGLTMMIVAGAGLAAAFANAPNPDSAISGTQSTNSDGSVTVSIGGSWSWAELGAANNPGNAKSSPQLNCTQRYGIGWAVDWWGVNPSASSPAFSLTDASEIAAVTQGENGTPPASGTADIAGAIKTPSGGFFHVPALYAGQEIFTPSFCAAFPSGTAPTGQWSATATYPNAKDIPALICVNLYDEHGQMGKPSSTTVGSGDFSPVKDGDNSIQTNDYNPAVNCFSSANLVPNNPSQTISGSILLCGSNGAPPATPQAVNGGSISATGQGANSGTTVGSPDQLAATKVPAGAYTMSATAPSGYQLVACGQSPNGFTTSGSPATGASQTVSVPSGGTGSGTFYVAPLAPGTQTIAGSILQCSATGSPTSTRVQGGSVSAAGQGANSGASVTSPNQLAATQVPAGSYTVSATAPSGYEFVACGQSPTDFTTTGNPASGASQTVTVPAGGAGTGYFYVVPVPAPTTQTVASAILLCDATGNPTTTLVPGGSVALQSGGATLLSSADQLPATPVAVGNYTLSASAPGSYSFVPCGQPGVTIGNPASTATQPADVTSGSSVVRNFYVAAPATVTPPPSPNTPAPAPPAPTVSGIILACGPNGTPPASPQDVNGGTVSLQSGSTIVTTAQNQLAATAANPGNYTLAATAPAGYEFVPCNLQGVTIATPTSANEPITVPSSGTVQGVFYVVPTPAVAAVAAPSTPAPAPAPTVAGLTVAPPAPAAPPALAYTGPPAALRYLLIVGFGLLSLGCFALWLTRPQRAAVRVDR